MDLTHFEWTGQEANTLLFFMGNNDISETRNPRRTSPTGKMTHTGLPLPSSSGEGKTSRTGPVITAIWWGTLETQCPQRRQTQDWFQRTHPT